MAVLLIGSTGNGKSTLGNYLLNPNEFKPGGKYFAVAKDNLPKTQHSSSEELKVTFQYVVDGSNSPKASKISSSDESLQTAESLTVIDTPGLNESKVKDFEHMIDLVTTLQEQDTIRACIFVVKFSAKIDQQYKETIKYYATLLPSLFSKNCLIVLTDYQTDDRSEEMRKMQGVDYDNIVSNVKQEICESSGIRFTPILFSIDCIPLGEKEKQSSLNARDAILSYIFSLNETSVTNLRVAKTKALLDEDEKTKTKCEGEIDGYSKRLEEANKGSKDALADVKKKEKEITDLETKKKEYQESLSDMDSDELITAYTWSVDDSWKFLRWQKKDFDITSQWEVKHVKTWTNGHSTFNYQRDGNRVYGNMQGDFMRRLYASITLETTKKLKFAHEIDKTKLRIEGLEKDTYHNSFKGCR